MVGEVFFFFAERFLFVFECGEVLVEFVKFIFGFLLNFLSVIDGVDELS